MSPSDANPHFLTADSWDEAARLVEFDPRRPTHTAGHDLASLRVHWRDHKKREIPVGARTLEAHYDAFVVSQQAAPSDAEARALAFDRSYGADDRQTRIAGHAARVYPRGPEPEESDVDGQMPAVVVWADGRVFFLIASHDLPLEVLLDIAESFYA